MKSIYSSVSLPLILGLLLSNQGCRPAEISQSPDSRDQKSDPVLTKDFSDPIQAWSEESTHYQTAQGSDQALPNDFPDYLEFPGATIVASGQISDAEGEISTLVLRTDQSLGSILKYYREKLWYQKWDILSEEIQQESAMITFNYSITDKIQQIVVQISTPLSQPQVRDIIVMLTRINPAPVLASSMDDFDGSVLLTLKGYSFLHHL